MRRRQKKWLIAKKARNLPIHVLGYEYRYTTKAKAQKEASKLNKRIKKLGVQKQISRKVNGKEYAKYVVVISLPLLRSWVGKRDNL
jgi:hypothetical protein